MIHPPFPYPFPPRAHTLAQLEPDINMLCKIYALHAATATGTGSALMPHFYFRCSLQLTVCCLLLLLLLWHCAQIEIDGRPSRRSPFAPHSLCVFNYLSIRRCRNNRRRSTLEQSYLLNCAKNANILQHCEGESEGECKLNYRLNSIVHCASQAARRIHA